MRLLKTNYTSDTSDRKSTLLHHNRLQHAFVNHSELLHLCRLERYHGVIGQHREGLPLPVQHLAEGRPELGGHEAVEEEVGGAVDEGEHVHDVPQRVVALLVELHPVDGGEEAQSSLHLECVIFSFLSLRQYHDGSFSNDEEPKQDYEKSGRPVCALSPPR